MPQGNYSTNYFDGTTNHLTFDFTINTCEWGNGSHILFATVEALSALGGPINTPSRVGNGVSAYVPVNFSNLISRISFSEPFFDPDAGQTQQVTAAFAANSDWTLNITDYDSNIVKTATGSGTSMSYDWDGTDNSNQPVRAGAYYYYISAQTNGESAESMMSHSFGSTSRLDESPLWWTVPLDGSGPAVPLSLYPPGMIDEDNFLMFEAVPSEMRMPKAASSMGRNFSTLEARSESYSGPSGQGSPRTPNRPPPVPMARVAGTFGFGYQTYSAIGDGYYQPTLPRNATGLGFITIEGHGTADAPKWTQLREADKEAYDFALEMGRGGWWPKIQKGDDQLSIGDLRGSETPFNQVNLGFLIFHGGTGDTMDYTVGGAKQMYFPIASGTSAEYLRMSEMNFGGAGTNGLKWMVIAACRSLNRNNWNSMQNQNVKPYNGDLHLLLGADTDIIIEPLIGTYFAKYLFRGTNGAPMTIRDAWIKAGNDAYRDGVKMGRFYRINPMKFIVAGDSACFDDTLQTNYAPQGTWIIPPAVVVYPPSQ